MGSLDGKNALVTGGTAGIGLASARALADAGAHVFLTGRTQSTIDAAVASIGASATGVRSDVSDPAQLDAIVEAVRAHGGGLDAVFTNAGGGEFATLEDTTIEHYLDTFNRNVAGTLFTVQKVLPLLNPGASVILSGSTSASKGIASFGAYAASKA
ncbi:MAG: SDR family NAD(P)-dependent oxidoreductase, partial [Actinomycetota bacterium]|nr:SDR family NAD(P)-dependent oxidoreductase [Actinomycetota bacterium]